MGDVLATIQRRAAEDPGHLLYTFLDAQGQVIETLTREGLLQRVRLIASHLGTVPRAEPGERVLIAYPPGLEMICAFFACAHVGLIPVPVASPTRPSLQSNLHRVAQIAGDCRPVAVLTTTRVSDLVSDYRATSDASAAAKGLLPALPWIATDGLNVPCGRPWTPNHSPILFLQYTSGSTSQPKGVMVSHENVLANASFTVDHPNAIGVSWLPQHHDMGLIGYYINGAIAGASLYGFSPASFIQRPALWLETISRYRATATSAPNFALEHCLRRGHLSPSAYQSLDLSSLKFLMVAAEPVRPDVYREFLHTFAACGLSADAFVVAYGLAENTLAVSSYGRDCLSLNRNALANGRTRITKRVADVSVARQVMSCGRPLGDNRVVIVDPERRRPRAEGEVGEVWVTGASKCLGYWNNPTSTAEVFAATLAEADDTGVEGEYLRTGDMGFMHQGELYVCGRRKDMIIIRGQNHYPQDIEAVVERECPTVRRSGVVAFEAYDDEPAVVVMAEQASPSAIPDALAIAAAVRNDLGISVDEIVIVPPRSIPKTSSGKIRRFLAKQMLVDEEIHVLQRVSLRRSIAAAADLLGADVPFAALRSRYGLTGEESCSLADAGVDSLDLVVFLHELSEILTAGGAGDLAQRLDLRTVQDRSVADLFGLVRRFGADPASALSQLHLMLSTQDEAGPMTDRELMRADRCLDVPMGSREMAHADGEAKSIFLTGATGFVGPFLLASLLEQTSARIHVLVRATTGTQGEARLRANLDAVAPRSAAFWRAFDDRVVVLAGNLETPRFGFDRELWARLAGEVDTIYHNGALVNYLLTYARMRTANVVGTQEVLRLAFESRPKVVNHVSTTFIFGWAKKSVLHESDDNAGMERLDFGYSQSKWVAEQLVLDARRHGLASRVFRPALITPSVMGGGINCDITLRLLAFMIKHGIGVDAANQISFLPADVTASNIVAIANRPDTMGQTFHVTRDHYAGMADVLDAITRFTGRRFEVYDLKAFVPEVIRRCTRADPLFPLLDFLIGSIENISSMAFKRYDNANYRRARDASPGGRPEPSFEETVCGILRFLNAAGLARVHLRTTTSIAVPD
jgi:thioester reductase-like protein